jgi:hypothetical protein
MYRLMNEKYFGKAKVIRETLVPRFNYDSVLRLGTKVIWVGTETSNWERKRGL